MCFASTNSFDAFNDDPTSPTSPTPVNTITPDPTVPRKCQGAQRRTPPTSAASLPQRPAHHEHATRNKTQYYSVQRQSAVNHAVLDNTSNPHRDHFVNSVIDPTTGGSLEYRHLIKGPDAKHYPQANINEIGWLTNGRVGGFEITGTNTGKFIHPSELPPGRTATYLCPVVTYRRQKADPYRMRWTVGGNLINYPGVTSTSNSEITTVKLLVNSTISIPNARFMCT